MTSPLKSKPGFYARSGSDRGATAIEYALIVAGVALAAVGGIQALGGAIGSVFGNQAGALAAQGVSPTPTPTPTQTTGSVAKKGSSTINVLSGVTGAALTDATITSEPSGSSSITWNANGSITYTAPNKSGTTVIRFAYVLNGVTRTATLTLTIA
jgi:Flp pilus assembly pilin Flp